MPEILSYAPPTVRSTRWWSSSPEIWARDFAILAAFAEVMGLIFFGGKGGGVGLNFLAIPVVAACGLGYVVSRIRCERDAPAWLRKVRIALAVTGVLVGIAAGLMSNTLLHDLRSDTYRKHYAGHGLLIAVVAVAYLITDVLRIRLTTRPSATDVPTPPK